MHTRWAHVPGASLQNARAEPRPQPRHLRPAARELTPGQPTLCPHPLCEPKGNKYKLYKVKGGPASPWGRACLAGPGSGRSGGVLGAGCPPPSHDP